MSNITIIGGGNMGSLLAAKFSQAHSVTLYISTEEKAKQFSRAMCIFNEDTKTYMEGKIKAITSNLKEAVADSEWIFITYPSFLFYEFAGDLTPCLKAGQHLVGVPGSGGFELYFKKAIEKGCTITGLQRVHSVARIIEQGKEVRESGIRPALKVASIPNSFNNEACEAISSFYHLPVEPLDNYLNITLINSNPILHTSRLYRIFHEYPLKKEYESVPLFYEEWDVESSDVLIKMDAELFSIFDALEKKGLQVHGITPLLKHYESNNAEEMKNKICSIKSLKGLKTPAILNENGMFVPDLQSRYFTADFPFGLDILLSFAELTEVSCLEMKKVSDWYHRVKGNERIFSLDVMALHNVDDLISFYC